MTMMHGHFKLVAKYRTLDLPVLCKPVLSLLLVLLLFPPLVLLLFPRLVLLLFLPALHNHLFPCQVEAP